MSTEPVRIGDTLDHRTNPSMTGGKVIEIHSTFAECKTSPGHQYRAFLTTAGTLREPDAWHHGAHRPPAVEVGGTITSPLGTPRTVRRIEGGRAFALRAGFAEDVCFYLDDRGALAEPDCVYTPPAAPAPPRSQGNGVVADIKLWSYTKEEMIGAARAVGRITSPPPPALPALPTLGDWLEEQATNPPPGLTPDAWRGVAVNFLVDRYGDDQSLAGAIAPGPDSCMHEAFAALRARYVAAEEERIVMGWRKARPVR